MSDKSMPVPKKLHVADFLYCTLCMPHASKDLFAKTNHTKNIPQSKDGSQLCPYNKKCHS